MRRGVQRILCASVLMAAVTSAACGTPTVPSFFYGIDRLSADSYSFLSGSSLHAPENLVIRDQASWANVWARIWADGSYKPVLPAIDFTKDMIVVTAMGDQPTSGYSILVRGAAKAFGAMTITFETTSPGLTCGVLDSVFAPLDIAKVPRHAGTVRFVEETKVEQCR